MPLWFFCILLASQHIRTPPMLGCSLCFSFSFPPPFLLRSRGSRTALFTLCCCHINCHFCFHDRPISRQASFFRSRSGSSGLSPLFNSVHTFFLIFLLSLDISFANYQSNHSSALYLGILSLEFWVSPPLPFTIYLPLSKSLRHAPGSDLLFLFPSFLFQRPLPFFSPSIPRPFLSKRVRPTSPSPSQLF